MWSRKFREDRLPRQGLANRQHQGGGKGDKFADTLDLFSFALHGRLEETGPLSRVHNASLYMIYRPRGSCIPAAFQGRLHGPPFVRNQS